MGHYNCVGLSEKQVQISANIDMKRVRNNAMEVVLHFREMFTGCYSYTYNEHKLIIDVVKEKV